MCRGIDEVPIDAGSDGERRRQTGLWIYSLAPPIPIAAASLVRRLDKSACVTLAEADPHGYSDRVVR